MNGYELRLKVAKWATKYIGITEGDRSHLKILSIFNDSKLCSRYKMTKDDQWCATTVSAAFIANELAGKPGDNKLFECVECSCGNMIELAKKQGIWNESDNYSPNIGDVVFYDWDDNNIYDNNGWPDHVGIVISNNGSTFKVIEGNINNTVGYRTIYINGKYIRGFITPDYTKFASEINNGSNKSTGLNKTCKFKGIVTASALNVRSWAGAEYIKIRTLSKDTEVEVCDEIKASNGNLWYYIKESGKYGFVSAKYIKK